MRPIPNPSTYLDRLIAGISPYTGSEEVTMSGESFDNIFSVLMTIRNMVLQLEREAGALRLQDAARKGRAIIDELATDQFVGLVIDPEGKVIRPDFRKKGE